MTQRSDGGLPTLTRLAAFMDATEIKPAVLSRESGYSRQHLLRLRKGTVEPTRICMVRLARACSSRLMRHVHVRELFDIGDDAFAPVTRATPVAVAVVARPGTRWLDRLRHAVRVSRKTQAEIARRAGLPEETVSRVMTGQSGNPKLETIVCIAHAIDCTKEVTVSNCIERGRGNRIRRRFRPTRSRALTLLSVVCFQ